MNRFKQPVVVMPPVYELSLGAFGPCRWCKLKEVCAVVPGLALLSRMDFSPTPEQLINRFVALVRPVFRKKMFRYSLSGNEVFEQEVPIRNEVPPYFPFNLGLGITHLNEMFVPEDWVVDTLRAIRRGAVAAVDFGDVGKIGFPPANTRRIPFLLEGSPETIVVRSPYLN